MTESGPPENNQMNGQIQMEGQQPPNEVQSQQQFDPNQQQFDPNQQQFDPNQQQFDPNQQQLDPNRQQFDQNQQQFDQNQQQFDPNQQQLDLQHPSEQAQGMGTSPLEPQQEQVESVPTEAPKQPIGSLKGRSFKDLSPEEQAIVKKKAMEMKKKKMQEQEATAEVNKNESSVELPPSVQIKVCLESFSWDIILSLYATYTITVIRVIVWY